MSQAVGLPITIDQPSGANDHLRADQVARLLRHELEQIGESVGGPVTVELLGRLKPVADATTKFLIRDRLRRPFAVIICSRPISPHLMLRGAERAEAVRLIVGQRLGEAIIAPMKSGYVEGRSYVILPWYRDVPTSRLGWAWMRRRLRRPIFDWLCEITRAAADVHGGGHDIAADFASVLTHLERQPFVGSDMRESLRRCLDRLSSGNWQPRHTVEHNDVYRSNILLRPRRAGARSEFPFVIIDWAGANPKGYGIYDLIRAARSLKAGSAALAREIQRHANALRCETCDVEGHLLASFGWLHRNIEHFPEDRYVAAITGCWRELRAAQRRIADAPPRRTWPGRSAASFVRRSVARPIQKSLERPGINRLYRRMSARSGAIVLMYHSVASPEDAHWIDPDNHVAADVFARQMQFLARDRNVLPLTQVIDALRAGENPGPDTVAITFDDGYLDNLTVAAPILDSLGLTATLFLPTGYIDRGQNHWIDEAWSTFAHRTKQSLMWGGDVGLTYNLNDESQRTTAYRNVCGSLISADLPRRDRLLSELRDALAPSVSPPRLTMNWDDVSRLLNEHSCFEIGGHTVDHLDMTACSPDEARKELTECRRRIEHCTGAEPRHFSFPYGRYSDALRALVKEAGFISAFGAASDPLIRAGSNCFALRRIKAPQTAERLIFLSSSANTGLLHRMGR